MKQRFNAYVCDNGHVHYTLDLHEGTTPFMMACLTCGQQSTSQMYQVNVAVAAAQHRHVWIKPTDEQLDAYISAAMEEHGITEVDEALPYAAGIRDHVERGGLILVERVPEETAKPEYRPKGLEAKNRTTYVRSERKMGRNELCWCGSGKKFKHCHGANK